MALNPPAAGEVVKSWTLQRRIGRGGNGEVWLAAGHGSPSVAIKFLTKPRLVAYKRFCDEIRIMRANADPGILPVVDSELPEDFETARSWYAMPVAKPLLDALDGLTLLEKVKAVAEIADTISTLHARDIVHRDIKPANLLILEGRYVLGDFGLVDFPDKDDLTGKREDLGSKWTMAPEVRRHADGADGKAADVYSLAKSLWMLVTGNLLGFDGQYSRAAGVSLGEVARDLFLTPLDAVLSDCTDHEPTRRPTMARLAQRLRQWIQIIDDFPERNRLEWQEIQRLLFPIVVPQRVIWEDLDDIVQVLTLLGERSNLNHLFFPRGGGLDLHGASRSQRESGCLEINTDGLIGILRPKRLLFESFPSQPHWSYFRLEADELAPSGVYSDLADLLHEELTDVGGVTYAERECWDADEFDGQPLPPRSRRVSRYLGGSFVIFQKTSPYNLNTGTYDARHHKMTTDGFRQHIADVIAYLAQERD